MHRYRPIAVLLTVLHLTACSTWQLVAVRSEPIPGTVRVTTDSGHIFLKDTRLVGDTAIAGVADGSLRSIPLTDARLVEQSHFSLRRTLGLSALAAGALYGLVLFALSLDDSRSRLF